MTRIVEMTTFVNENGTTVFCDKYQTKEMKVPLWRYGFIKESERYGRLGVVVKDMLRSKPSKKTLNNL